MTTLTTAVLTAGLLTAAAPAVAQQDAGRLSPRARLLVARALVETMSNEGMLPAAPQTLPAAERDTESPDDRPRCLMPVVTADPAIDSRMVVQVAPAFRTTMPVVEVGCRP